MKKIYAGILTIICALTLGIFSACGSDVKISVKQEYIEAFIGDTFDLASYFEADKKVELEYSSLDRDVASVSDGQVVAVGEGVTFLQAEFENSKATIELKVKALPPTASVPQNVNFDKEQNALVWNAQYITLDGQTSVVNSYTVLAEGNQETKEFTVVGKTIFTELLEGNYSYKVRANGLKNEGITIYNESEYSQAVLVQKQKQATNLKFDKQTNILSWEHSDQDAKFRVVVNGIAGEIISQKQCQLNLFDEYATQNTVYNISVMVIGEGENSCPSQSQTLSLTRLVAPAIDINNGVVTWNNPIVEGYHYELEITDSKGEKQTVEVSGGKWTFDSAVAGEVYSIALGAVSDSENILSSENQTVIDGITKLESLTLEYDAQTKMLTVDDYSNKDIQIEIKGPGLYLEKLDRDQIESLDPDNLSEEILIKYPYLKEEIKFDPTKWDDKFWVAKFQIITSPDEMTNGQYEFTYKGVGKYEIKVQNKSQTTKEIDSDYSNQITIINIQKVSSSKAVHYVDEHGDYILNFENVEDANAYDVMVDGTKVNHQNNSLGNAKSLFSQNKEYSLSIKAYSSVSGENGIYVTPSVVNFSVKRLSDVQIMETQQLNPTQIEWNAVDGAKYYQINVYKNGELQTELSKQNHTETVFDTSNFDFGNYKLEIIAKADQNSQTKIQNVLVLDSLNASSVEFKVSKQLDAVSFDFDLETKILTIHKVPNANLYKITFNFASSVTSLDTEDSIIVDLSTVLESGQQGDYVIDVVSKHNTEVLLLDSEIATYTITKLQTPQKMKLDSDGTISLLDEIDSNTLNVKGNFTLLVDDVETYKVEGDLARFVVKAKYNATKEQTSNQSYIDSNYVQFEIKRIDAPTIEKLEDTKLYWNYLDNELFENRILFIQDEKQFEIQADSTSPYDISTNEQIDYTKDFEVKIRYFAKSQEFDASSGEVLFTSNYSESYIAEKISDEILFEVVETDVVTISWDQSQIQDVTYSLYLEDELLTQTQQTQYQSEFIDAKIYNLYLVVSKAGYLPSNKIKLTIERFAGDVELTIKSDDSISAQTSFDQAKNELAVEKISIKVGENEVTSLSEFNSQFQVQTQIVAKQQEKGNQFFLSSSICTYNFNRITTMTAPTTGRVVEYSEVNNTDSYIVRFETAEGEKVDITSSEANLDLTDETIQSKLWNLGQTSLEVSVKASKDEYVASTEQTNWLSSYFSPKSQLILLDDPANLEVSTTSTDYTQRPIKFTWTHNHNSGYVHGFEFVVYYEGQEIDYMVGQTKVNPIYVIDNTTEQEYSTEMLSELFNNAGKYKVVVLALDGEGSLAKVAENSYVEFEVLQSPNNLTMDENAVLSWSQVNNASSYVVKYYYSDQVQAIKENITDTKIDLKELFDIDFFGNFTVEVLSVGESGQNQTKTFSSLFSQKLTITKLQKPTLIFEVDSVSIGGEFDSNAKFMLSIKYDNQVIKQLEMSIGEEYKFEDWTKADGSKIDSNVEQEFTFEVINLPTEQNTIKSSVQSQSVTRLASISNYGFRKIDGVIQFACDPVQNSSRLIADFGNFNSDAFSLSGEKQVLIIDQFLAQLESQFSLSIIAKGEINNTGTTYINSVSTTLQGSKLPEVEGIAIKDGMLVFDKIDTASDYNILVGDDVLSGYVAGPLHITTHSLRGYEGELTINVKAIGNLTQDLKTENIVLDSLYNYDSESGQRVDKVVYKLPKITSISVYEGKIAFETNEKATSYEIIVNENYYNLTTFKKLENITQFNSSQMYEALTGNQNYYAQVIAKSDEENVLYSDLSNEIIINILSNDTRGSVKVQKKIKSYDPLEYDYTASNLIWTDCANAVNGYIVKIAGKEFATNTPLLELTAIEGLLPGTLYTAQVCIAGTSEKDENGVYYLSSHYGEEVMFQKLDTPTVYVEDGLLCWDQVEGATGYIVILDDSQVNTKFITETSYFYSGSDKEYATYEVVAISSLDMCIASEKGLYVQTTQEPQKVIKLKSPKMFEITDGSFGVGVSTSDLTSFGFNKEYVITDPFKTTQDSIAKEKLILKFTNSASYEEYQYTMPAVMFVKLTSSQISMVEFALSGSPLLDMLTKSGWPTNDNLFADYADGLPAGEYTLSLAQVGDDIKYLTSNFGGNKTVYVPYAPKIRIEFENDSFMLKWDDIQIPSKFSNSDNVEYVIVATEENEEQSIYAKDTKITTIAQTNSTQLNLTELIDNGTITKDMSSIQVYVKGDDSSVINGKFSNQIDIEVLDETKAFVHEGELSWTPQESAMGYYVYYYPLEQVDQEQRVYVSEPLWDCKQLSSEYEYYTIHIQAVGAEVDSWTEITLSGEKSNVGKISKLPVPILSVEDSIIKWTNIKNATSYYGTVMNKQGELLGNPYVSIADQIVVGGQTQEGTCYYESTFMEENATYAFRAMGSIDVALGEGITAYVNSDNSSQIVGTTIDSVQNITVVDGLINWDTIMFKGSYISDYRLTFTKVSEEGEAINEKIVVFVGDANHGDICVYDCSEILQAGKYQVEIQPYFTTNDVLGKFEFGSQTGYYLMGLSEQSYNFTKLDVVENISIKDSVITWDYTQTDIDAMFKLIFSDVKLGTNNQIVIYAETNEYSSYIVEQLIVENAFTLQIKTTPAQQVEAVVDSSSVAYQNQDGLLNINQLNAISDDEIKLTTSTIEGTEDVEAYISWKDYHNKLQNLEVKYLITYWINNEEPKQMLIDDYQIKTSELNFVISSDDAGNSNLISYTIQVIPQGTKDNLVSYPSNVHEIQKPAQIPAVMFDEQTGTFSWDTYMSSKDHVFRIVDEIVERDASGEIVLNEDGTYKVLHRYEYTTLDGETLTYAPAMQGTHIVSVAVIVRNNVGEGGLMSNFQYYFEDIEDMQVGTAVDINLFAKGSGDGTAENPYLISNRQHFANMIYRFDKPEYMTSYKYDGEYITLEDENKEYNFKQTADILNASSIYNNGASFFGTYDGDYYKLKWSVDLTTLKTITVASLFGTVEQSATIKNVHLFTDYGTKAPTKSVSVSNLAYKNAGTISNIKVGALGETISITSDYDLTVSMLVYENVGTIESVANYYNVALVNSTTLNGNRLSFAGISYANQGKISCCANYGTMNLTSTQVTAGGIVANNITSGVIDGCVYSSSKMVVSITKQGTQPVDISVMVGGIVGLNQQGQIAHSYTRTEMNVVRSALSSNATIAVGGLVGRSNETKISYSYVDVTKASSSISDGVYQVVGQIAVSTSGSGKTVYYKSQTSFTSGGDDRFTPSTYTTYPTGLNDDGNTYFDIRVSSMPTLYWEATFVEIWNTNAKA